MRADPPVAYERWVLVSMVYLVHRRFAACILGHPGANARSGAQTYSANPPPDPKRDKSQEKFHPLIHEFRRHVGPRGVKILTVEWILIDPVETAGCQKKLLGVQTVKSDHDRLVIERTGELKILLIGLAISKRALLLRAPVDQFHCVPGFFVRCLKKGIAALRSPNCQVARRVYEHPMPRRVRHGPVPAEAIHIPHTV